MGMLISDKYQLEYLSSSRNLAIENQVASTPTVKTFLYGGIKYSSDSLAIAAAVPYRGEEESDFDFNDTDLIPKDTIRNRGWSYLQATKEEVEELDQLLSRKKYIVKSFQAFNATEESFKALGVSEASPDILHIATHGFFFPDLKISKEILNDYMTGGRANFRFSDNPLFRSGLIFAGANRAWQDGRPLKGFEDGILTAYEISQMDLTGTKLAVLSACKTGLGDIRGSEGVYGLQRAFKMAGVDYLILTLWNIPDDQHTVDFMKTFYKYWLKKKLPIKEAFNKTQKKMRKQDPNPFHWAGFLLIE